VHVARRERAQKNGRGFARPVKPRAIPVYPFVINFTLSRTTIFTLAGARRHRRAPTHPRVDNARPARCYRASRLGPTIARLPLKIGRHIFTTLLHFYRAVSLDFQRSLSSASSFTVHRHSHSAFADCPFSSSLVSRERFTAETRSPPFYPRIVRQQFRPSAAVFCRFLLSPCPAAPAIHPSLSRWNPPRT